MRRDNLPLISILTPSLNKVDFVEEAIDSVISQKYPNIEHIIVDGISKDGTLEILKKYKKKHKHIKLIVGKDKSHIDALNKGLTFCKGDIISVLNADDYYAPNTFRTVVETFQKQKDVDLVVGKCAIVNEKGIIKRISIPSVDLNKVLFVGWYDFPVNPSSYFYRNVHKKIGNFDPNFGLEFDYEFFLRLLSNSKAIFVDQIFGYFRYYSGSKTYINRSQTMKNIYRISMEYNKSKGRLNNFFHKISFYLFLLVRKVYYFGLNILNFKAH